MGAIAVAMLLIPAGARAADPTPGEAAYRRYCGACHGISGKGDGVAAGTMRPKPTDLTQIAKRHRGTFPYVLVKESIDGRKPIAAHGDSAMPVWGLIFAEEKAQNPTSAAEVRGQVQLITDYVATIQAK